MVSVNVAELKNRLSKYLTFVKEGEENRYPGQKPPRGQAGSVLRRRSHRGRTAVGCSCENASAQILVKVWDLLKIPAGEVSGSEGIQALLDEREETR